METGPRLEGEYQIEFQEYYHALRWYSWRKSWWCYCIVIVGITLLIVNTFFRPESDASWNRITVILPTLIIPVLLASWLYWAVYRNARRQFKTNNSIREVRHFLISEDELESSTSVSSGKVAWSTLHKVLETPESFLFFSSNAAFSVFPKRSLKTDDRIQILRNLIGKKLGTRAKLKKV